jgi:hypothetical protein
VKGVRKQQAKPHSGGVLPAQTAPVAKPPDCHSPALLHPNIYETTKQKGDKHKTQKRCEKNKKRGKNEIN